MHKIACSVAERAKNASMSDQIDILFQVSEMIKNNTKITCAKDFNKNSGMLTFLMFVKKIESPSIEEHDLVDEMPKWSGISIEGDGREIIKKLKEEIVYIKDDARQKKISLENHPIIKVAFSRLRQLSK